MKKKAIIKWTRCDLFNADIVLIVCPWEDLLGAAKEALTKEKFETLSKQYETHGHDPYSLALQFPFGGGGSLIWGKPHATVGTLVHEITHAAHHLLKQRSVPLSEDTEEVYAYMIEFLFNNLTKK